MIKLNPKKSLLIVLSLLLITLVLYFPKIYLINNIYYVSKDINKMYSHYISLKEENKFLAQQLEDMKFKNQIEDSLIIYSIEGNYGTKSN
ncbi:hypothetical protein CRV08_00465 [Halarcobacter ebronensis]|uniref:Septum formation initiator n=1 Tax=Halarcobacter ebronensis TaxID=1462615 RepID=A0A4Q0YHF5_9BACT|nr:hypothetical protein [Halarcobacter ebronensis]QKF82220.1 hypothetical protein AEBR_1737 [Halarcobacter ebronensis]RXJ70070.1 hypothetical protein CRV08_00465 [Halarcobacter ebronensis]RXK03404.1 hypothetical protein CRV07_12035 [Halarcobacter ebronensis]